MGKKRCKKVAVPEVYVIPGPDVVHREARLLQIVDDAALAQEVPGPEGEEVGVRSVDQEINHPGGHALIASLDQLQLKVSV